MEIDAKTLASRLKSARLAKRGLTQERAASALGVSRSTLIAIEQGTRKVSRQELVEFGKVYECPISQFVSPNSSPISVQTKFRRLGSGESEDSKSAAAVRILSQMVTAEVELERLLGVSRVLDYPPPIAPQPANVRQQAEDAATAVRQRLGLGLSPIHDPIRLAEEVLRVRVFIRPLPSDISGLFFFDHASGASILLNSSHSRLRQNLTCAHEIGHLLSTRPEAEILEGEADTSSLEERFATAFSVSFLMPGTDVRLRFSEHANSAGRFTPRHLALLARYYEVSVEGMCRRLEGLDLLPSGTFDSLRRRGFKQGPLQALDGDSASLGRSDRVTRVYVLAAEALQRELLTEGQLVDLLGVPRNELRKLVDQVDIDGPADLLAERNAR